MKTERRHALQTNWLADHLGRWLDKVKPYTNHILVGLCVVAAGWAIWMVVAWVSRGDEEEAWKQLRANTSRMALFNRIEEETSSDNERLRNKRNELRTLQETPAAADKQSQDERKQKVKDLNNEIVAIQAQIRSKLAAIEASEHDDLCRLAEKNISTVAGRAAAFAAAGLDLADGTESLLKDPVGAREKLDRAEKFFLLVKDNSRDKLERQRAQLELARLYETRLKRDAQHSENDDIAKAKREYESLAKQSPPSYCKAEAEQRLAAITAAIDDPSKHPLFDWMSRELEKQIEQGGKVKVPPLTPPPDPDAE